jgi:hypothetical protein
VTIAQTLGHAELQRYQEALAALPDADHTAGPMPQNAAAAPNRLLPRSIDVDLAGEDEEETQAEDAESAPGGAKAPAKERKKCAVM